MNLFKKYPNFLKYTSLATITTTSVGWLLYQIKTTQDILSNALDTSVLSITEPSIPDKAKNDFFVIDTPKYHDQEYSFESTWSSFKFMFAKRLVLLANNENKYIRKKAVRQLARMKNLDYWHFSLLSNMIDARTAVGLARTPNSDPRLFAEPPIRYLAYTQDMLVDVMKDLLVELHEESQHPCMGYFISKAFADPHDVERFSDNEASSLALKKYIQNSHEVLPLCLESLLHHASVKSYAKDIAKLNGLPLLMEIHNRFRDDVKVTATICRIISYLSMHRELLDDLHKSGWVGVLAMWMKHDDVRISIPAAKALTNLDLDEHPVYLQRLYPLHPSTRKLRKAGADVVFVHGLMGGVFFTWRQRKRTQNPLGFFGKNGKTESITQDAKIAKFRISKPPRRSLLSASSDPNVQEFIEELEEHFACDNLCSEYEIVWEDVPTNTNDEALGSYCCPSSRYSSLEREEDSYTSCWPRDWLATDCEQLRIIGVNYESNLSLWTPICPVETVKTLEERSEELMWQLRKAGVGKRPIIWVTHSMGGLMVKNLLNKARESEIEEIKDMCLNTKGVVFFSTPHRGSSVARFNQATALVIWPTTEVQELQENSPKLIDIHEKFLQLAKEVPMKIVTFTETEPTVVSAMKFKFLIVPPHSGNPGIGEYYEIPLDHLGICKPVSRQSFLYQKVLSVIEDILHENKTHK